jgi:hypothetical protein
VNVRFFDRFMLHMMFPVMVVITCMIAFAVARMCTPSGPSHAYSLMRINESTSKIIVLVFLLLYPGLSTKVFQMMKCVSIDGIEGQLLVQDYSITCNEGEHVYYGVLAGIGLCVYVIGIPLVMFLLLWWNHRHLHDTKSHRHGWVNTVLGSVFLQCKFLMMLCLVGDGCSCLILYFYCIVHYLSKTNLNFGGLNRWFC